MIFAAELRRPAAAVGEAAAAMLADIVEGADRLLV
jgi:hypothetical protein